MRYSYEFKKNAVELYRQGKWIETPVGVSQKSFRDKVREWNRREKAQGPEAYKHNTHNRVWTPDDKLELVLKVIAGHSITSVAFDAGINDGMLYQWVRKYKLTGYNGLINQKKGRKSKTSDMKKINYNNPRKIDESEYEELLRLRAENEYIKAEIEVIKKEIALREQKEAAQLKAKRQQSFKNSENKDIH
jgi:transposase-like protein